MADELSVSRSTGISPIIPSTVDQVDAFAERLMRGNYPIPAWIREKAKDPTAMVSAMILRGLSLGMEPFTALESFYEIKGRLGLYAAAMAARVLSSGVCVSWKVSVEKVAVEGKSDLVATVEYQRKGMAPTKATFSWSDAVQAGYTSNTKYKSDPKAMLKARAIAIACREGFPDVLRGMNYAAEEIEDFKEAEVIPAVEPPKPAAGTGDTVKPARKARAKPEPEAAPAAPVAEATFSPPEVPEESGDPAADLFDPDSMAP